MSKDGTYKEYASDVLSGKQIAGTPIRLACKRYLSWFERDDMYFDAKAADRVVKFVERFTLSTGKFSHKHFLLCPWQKWLIYQIYGFKWKDSGKRVIRDVYIQLSRKSGKTALASALAMYHLIADHEGEAQVVFAANSFSQAQLAFTMAKNYADSIDPRRRYLKTYRDQIRFEATHSDIRVVSADASRLDGLNVSMAVIDEYHAAKDPSVYNVLSSSMGMREQPLMLTITTAGYNMQGPCYEKRNLCLDILAGKEVDDSVAAFIYELDGDDDIQDEKNWVKCQPNLNYTVEESYIKSELVKAKMTPSAMRDFRIKILDQWVASAQEEWIPSEYIRKDSKKVSLSDYSGEYCYVGLDLSSTDDITAVSALVHKDKKWIFKNYYFLPETALKESPNRELYIKWKDQGYLTITQGNVIDIDYIFNTVMEINRQCPIYCISYDAWQSTAIIVKFTEAGINCQPFSQSIGSMNRPTQHLELIARKGTMIIDDNPITRWMFSNCTIKEDQNGNRKPVKQSKSSKRKIDGIAAMSDALGQWLTDTHYDNVVGGFTY